jgi:hypothetical protein
LTGLLGLLSVLPGLVLLLVSVLFLFGLVQALAQSPQLLFRFMLIGLFLGFVWWLYMRLPGMLKQWLLQLFGKSGGGGGHSGH